MRAAWLAHEPLAAHPGLRSTMKGNTSHRVCAGAAEVVLVAAALYAVPANAQSIAVAPETMPSIATIDPRYQSYNVEMAEVVGGTFWKPYAKLGEVAGHTAPATGGSNPASTAFVIGQNPAMFDARPPVDLSNARLRKLAAALGPAYVRVSGTW